ncbi:MAG: DUF4037 domain-containing protein [Actinomycetota bacterium]|nr:DUF4037 domain-containing protein [Actinomycetota bacterium]
MPVFEPGLELSRRFYAEVVEPALAGVPHAAGLFGWGSDVLGYDSERSTDHGWGPRALVFVDAERRDEAVERVEACLPETFRGWPTRFGWDDVAPRHHVEVTSVHDWFTARLGFAPGEGISVFDWLLAPQQVLLEVTGGAVFRDDGDDLGAARSWLRWYPDQVWLWLLACQWRRLEQEEAFVGRAAEVGDELGARVTAARLVRDLVRLCFLIERRYAPYGKWLGRAFAELDAGAEVGPALEQALATDDHVGREEGLTAAYQAVATRHNALGVTDPVDPGARPFHERPYLVLGAGRFVAACRDQLHDPALRALPLVGSVDQFADSSDILSRSQRARALRPVFGTPEPGELGSAGAR